MLRALANRALIEVSGKDREKFLQGLVTIDIGTVVGGAMRWGSFLTAQGRIIATTFFGSVGDAILIDCHVEEVERIFSMLSFYKLKLDVQIKRSELVVGSSLKKISAQHDGSKLITTDPRLNELGMRGFVPKSSIDTSDIAEELAQLESQHGIFDLPQNPALPLLAYEANLDLLGGIDWSKGCYIGQEVTARVKYRGQEKKRVVACEVLQNSRALDDHDPILKNTNNEELGVIVSSKKTLWALIKKEFIGTEADFHTIDCTGRIKFNQPQWMEITEK